MCSLEGYKCLLWNTKDFFFWIQNFLLTFSEVKGVSSIVKFFLTFWKVTSGWVFQRSATKSRSKSNRRQQQKQQNKQQKQKKQHKQQKPHKQPNSSKTGKKQKNQQQQQHKHEKTAATAAQTEATAQKQHKQQEKQYKHFGRSKAGKDWFFNCRRLESTPAAAAAKQQKQQKQHKKHKQQRKQQTKAAAETATKRPEGGGPEGPERRGPDGLFVLSLASFRGISVVLKCWGPPKCTFGVLWVIVCEPLRPRSGGSGGTSQARHPAGGSTAGRLGEGCLAEGLRRRGGPVEDMKNEK